MTLQPILRMQGVRKTFGPVVALHNVSLQLQSNEIHGLLGGNGAGKTTLVNVLYGLYRPDAGQIELEGRPIEIHSPRDAINHGIGMVHQHFLEIDNFSVTENIVLGTPLKNRPTLDLREAEQKIKLLADQFGLVVNPRALIEDLPMGARQRVEILKALYRGVKILILDEPTTNLTPQEVDSLFQSLRVMVEAGLSVVFITHKLREVLSVCDQITVLREGQNVLTLPRSEAAEELFVKAMVGEELDIETSLLFSQGRRNPGRPITPDRQPVLQITDLEVVNDNKQPVVKNCSLTVYQGEILGLAGVAGNGQKGLAESIMGLWPLSGGDILIDNVSLAKTGATKLLGGLVAYIPEDRLQDGFLPRANVAQNLILGFQRREPYSRNGLLNWKTIYHTARRLIAEYNIRTPGPEEVGANLSGGNIQRVLIARAFSHPARLLVAHNPTQGLDIPSMEFVYSKLLERQEQGGATLLISENLDELLLLCDRIATIYRGQIVGILERGAFDKYEIGRMMSGIRAVA
jgi:ABC-type uncharacterized transport system ATPase subunit